MSQSHAPLLPRLGTCSSCLRSHRITSSGLLYNHGPRAAQCPGTGRPPLGASLNQQHSAVSCIQLTSSQPAAATLPPTALPAVTQPVSSDSSLVSRLSAVFAQHPLPVARWIPKSARRACATGLQSILNAVVSISNCTLG